MVIFNIRDDTWVGEKILAKLLRKGESLKVKTLLCSTRLTTDRESLEVI